MTNKILEEILWKDGKFVKIGNKKIKPEPIGRIQTLKVRTSIFLLKTPQDYKKEFNYSLSTLLGNLQKRENKYSEANAFMIGEGRITKEVGVYCRIFPCNFYKI